MVNGYKDKAAVITGAASGLGRALARELAARSCHLALIDIDAAALTKTAQELRESGAAVTQHCADVSSERSLNQVAGEVEKAHGTVHLLINNAGISASASFSNTSPAEFERIIQVNFLGVVYGCRVFLPLLRAHGEGQILNVSSCFAWLGCPGKTAYASSKAALRTFSESLRGEVAGHGVGVTVLYPGPMRTSLVRSGFSDSAVRLEQEQKLLQARGIPLERVARKALDQLVSNPSRIVIGTDYFLLDSLTRLSPRLAGWAMRLGMDRLLA